MPNSDLTKATVDQSALSAIAGGYHGAPFDVLGQHLTERDGKQGIAIRTFQPQATSVSVSSGGKLTPMEKVHSDGIFEAFFTRRKKHFVYQLDVTLFDGNVYQAEDPYRFLPFLSDYDMHLFIEGNHFKLYDKFGAHAMELEGVAGVGFALWAPNAERVSVIGDFNQWDGRRLPMRSRGDSGVWELFVPGVAVGDVYKYEIRSRNMGYVVKKADPYAFSAELRPRTGSVVADIETYAWQDAVWMAERKERQRLNAPISVYEVHLGSWQRVPEDGNRWLTYRELADRLIPYVQEMGFTHIELLPVTEHPFDGSWGYQAVGYFAPTSRFGSPQDFQYFVDACHQANIGVILDWVPAHFPKDEHGLSYFDGTHLYEHADPRLGEHQDWGTLIFNYGRNEVQSFLLNSALFWLDKYHIDGIRVDAVASMLYLDYSREAGQWIPNQYGGRENLEAIAFLKRFNEVLHLDYPDVLTFAEESTSWPGVSRPTYVGGLGFDLKWNMGWMHDTLEYFKQDPVHRRYHQGMLTFSLLYAFTENFILPFSHDEVVHGKGSMIDRMPGDQWQKFANLRLLYTFMACHPGKTLLFMGCEFGQYQEWRFAQSLDWNLLEYPLHQQLRGLVAALNHMQQAQPALHQLDFESRGFEWIDMHDAENSVITFIRRAEDPTDFVVVACNLTPVPRENYRIGVPQHGFYTELFNSDAAEYGGANIGNYGGVHAQDQSWQGRPASLDITLPPLAVVVFKPA